jgi:hypothetical protein
MKKLLSLSAAAVAALVLASSAGAQVVSLEYGSNAVSANGESAGFLSESVWNSVTSTSYVGPTVTTTASGLIDSNGNVSGITASLVNDGAYHAGGSTAFANPGDNDLFGGDSLLDYNSSSDTLTLSGLSSGLTYDLFVYIHDPNGAPGTAFSFSGAGETYYGTTISNSVNSSYVLATGLTSATANSSDYIEITGITGTSFTGTFGGGGIALSGFQLEVAGSGPATPEPSAIWLLSLGLLSVGFFVRRNRAAREI